MGSGSLLFYTVDLVGEETFKVLKTLKVF